MILEILACVGVYNIVKGINITIESSEHGRNFLSHMNHSRDSVQNKWDGYLSQRQLGCPIDSNPREYWEDGIRQGQNQNQRDIGR
jgi:hypothetical protein